MFKNFKLLLILLMSSNSAHSQEGLVGFEWTFTNSDLAESLSPEIHNLEIPPISSLESDINRPSQNSMDRVVETWLREIKAECPKCTIEGARVHTPEGFWFEITEDMKVLEVITKPMTYSQLQMRYEILNRLVWKSAKKAGVAPHKSLGGGHLHLDIESHFGNDKLLFRNFVVDLANRPQLFMGGFGINYFNPPLSLYEPNELGGFKKIIADFDTDPRQDTADLIAKINDFYKTVSNPMMRIQSEKFQALNFAHLSIGTVEIRAVRPQISLEHALRLVKMFQSRIGVLRKEASPLKLLIPDHSKAYGLKYKNGDRLYTHDFDASEILLSIQNYAADGGLNPDFYNDFVTEELKDNLIVKSQSKKASRSKSAGFCSSFL